jgi:anion-transporting  ArsA/GET3 family ATPase
MIGVSPELPSNDFGLARPLGTRRFIFITGKGGVGKTTVAASLALALAKLGKRVLIAMCNTKERLSTLFGTAPVGHATTLVSEGVWATNIAPELALREYVEMVLRIGSVARAVFENKYTKAFFRATPGLSEWAILGKAWFHATEQLADGSFRFDVVLLDAPATGHGMDMLRVPKVILDVVPPGILRRDAAKAWTMFQDERMSGVIVVTLPEEMPTTETIELVTSVRSELQLPLFAVVVNGRFEPLFSPEEQRQLVADPALHDIDAPEKAAHSSRRALVAGAFRAMREQIQADSIQRLEQTIDGRKVVLPFLFERAATLAGIRSLASVL